jgi:uncharacterized membrane protein YqjE
VSVTDESAPAVRGDAGGGGDIPSEAQGIADAVSDVSEHVLRLVHEEIELAKAEVSEKVTRLLKGAVVGAAAGMFVAAAAWFVLVGLALLAYYYLPDEGEFFWGFFVVAGGLLVLAILAGVIAARAVKAGSPPVPSMAIDEARKIRESVSAGPATSAARAVASSWPFGPGEPMGATGAPGEHAVVDVPPLAAPGGPAQATASMPGWDPLPGAGGAAQTPVGAQHAGGEQPRSEDDGA